jgi:hypothetical protein
MRGLARHNCLGLLAAVGNLVGAEGVGELVSCQSLRSLHFRGLGGEDGNPICERPDYRASMFALLPQLRKLDYLKKDTSFDIDSIPKTRK